MDEETPEPIKTQILSLGNSEAQNQMAQRRGAATGLCPCGALLQPFPVLPLQACLHVGSSLAKMLIKNWILSAYLLAEEY